ncbi:MAG TPA: LysR family transcriptional regulator [Burkholderiaceae bacterium]|nr:LysR family transcriptional regulator [Burkholderiaceae bacterium]
MSNASDVPLIAIRAFVAAGRYGSFTRAAAALSVTQGAVSRHVATLEALADTRLFERKGSTIALTPAGSHFYDTVKDAMSTIELAARQLAQRRRAPDRLRVRTSMPSFAMTVVVPALGAFAQTCPVQVDLITSLAPPQPQDEFDVLISRDLRLPGTDSWELLREELVCVGAPALVAAQHKRAPARWPMITARSRPDLITHWAVARDIAPQRLQVAGSYDHLFLAMAAAIGGAGLLVVPRVLVDDALRDGTLALADPQPLASGARYIAYVHPASQHAAVARDFCRWLKGLLRERTRRMPSPSAPVDVTPGTGKKRTIVLKR